MAEGARLCCFWSLVTGCGLLLLLLLRLYLLLLLLLLLLSIWKHPLRQGKCPVALILQVLCMQHSRAKNIQVLWKLKTAIAEKGCEGAQ